MTNGSKAKFLLLISLFLPASVSSQAGNVPGAIELGVLEELNKARTDPKSYAEILKEYRTRIKGDILSRPGRISVRLSEGTRAVDEAIAFLSRQKPLLPLTMSAGMSLAARSLAKDQEKGAIGHTGADGSTLPERLSRYGEWGISAGENCAYGGPAARDFMIQLIIDDGVPSRGHRTNIFNESFLRVGIAVGPHAKYDFVCVQDFAGSYAEKPVN